MQRIAQILVRYVRLPFSAINIPGAVMEGVLAHVRGGEVLRTYDFVDVVERQEGLGWQGKSTLEQTPVTWKRAKIPDRNELIEASINSDEATQVLGDAIIDFCNLHGEESLRLYNLHTILYSRLVIRENGNALYFERTLCTRDNPNVFDKKEFTWSWSKAKITTKKEQLQALHGIHKPTGRKWFAWHGRGENQLHFSGEKAWWPKTDDSHAIAFRLPSVEEKLSLEEFIDLLAASRTVAPL